MTDVMGISSFQDFHVHSTSAGGSAFSETIRLRVCLAIYNARSAILQSLSISRLVEKFVQIIFDAGQASAFMQLAAWELGVGSCPASIYEPEKAREILGFPAGWHLRVALSFGYSAEEEVLSAAPKKGGRKLLDEVVHWDRW